MTINEIKQKILELSPRSAWNRAVQSDALDLLDALDGDTLPANWLEAEKTLLNGARDWRSYSYGGCALVYNGDIAEHYCTASELRRVTRKGGRISEMANSQENWCDVQARALWQAAQLIKNVAGL